MVKDIARAAIASGDLPRGSYLVAYKREQGCYRTIKAVNGRQLVGKYGERGTRAEAGHHEPPASPENHARRPPSARPRPGTRLAEQRCSVLLLTTAPPAAQHSTLRPALVAGFGFEAVFKNKLDRAYELKAQVEVATVNTRNKRVLAGEFDIQPIVY